MVQEIHFFIFYLNVIFFTRTDFYNFFKCHLPTTSRNARCACVASSVCKNGVRVGGETLIFETYACCHTSNTRYSPGGTFAPDAQSKLTFIATSARFTTITTKSPPLSGPLHTSILLLPLGGHFSTMF